MAPSPENDNAPKAPDKKGEQHQTTTAVANVNETKIHDQDNKEASVSRLDDVELKALLDEAINYKTPKDRVGKSKLFQNLLDKAEEDDRKARATSASGSESVRYYNTTATHRTRRQRKPSSVSENLTHGGSLNNLAKEELYAAATHLNRPPKTVSARQRQGGSLPCNVNSGITHDKQFFEEEARRRNESKKLEYTAIDMESQNLLEHDALNQEYSEHSEMEVVQTRIPRIPVKFTSRLSLEIGSGGGSSGTKLDDPLAIAALERLGEKVPDGEGSYKSSEPSIVTPATHYPSSAAHYSLLMPGSLWPFNRKSVEDKKVDENGNALGQNSTDAKKSKKKKIQTDKNVLVIKAKDVAGHRSDIINDLDKLVEYIGGNDEQSGTKSKSNVHKTKLHKHHFSSTDDKSSSSNKKQRIRSSKVKTEKLQKSNSMEELSVTKLDDFSFSQDSDGKVPLRGTKSNAERPRERRSWGNSESLPLHASAENLESSDFRVVTKKKKSKKRRSSVSSSGRKQPYSRDVHNRAPSPEPRRKSACSAPHSDKSNDSSDIDSVHSLPIDSERVNIEDGERLGSNMPISYADIAKNSNSLDRPKWNRLPSERKASTGNNGSANPNVAAFDKSGNASTNSEVIIENNSVKSELVEKPIKIKTCGTIPNVLQQQQPQQQQQQQQQPQPPASQTQPQPNVTDTNCGPKNVPLDVNNVQSWPTIQNNNNNNKNINYGVSQQRSQTNHNLKNNLKNIQQVQQQQQQQQHQQKVVGRAGTNLNNNMHVESAVQLIQNSDQMCGNNALPRNIPDVQTIEKMHLKQLQQQAALQQHQQQQQQQLEIITNHVQLQQQLATYVQHPQSIGGGGGGDCMANNNRNEFNSGGGGGERATSTNVTVPSASENCDSERTSFTTRPAVVILSGDGKEVSGLTFGFDINEQLLSDDVCDNFTARFYVPDVFQSHNHDKIVNFIGLAWEDTINQSNGKVKYFNDKL